MNRTMYVSSWGGRLGPIKLSPSTPLPVTAARDALAALDRTPGA